MQIVLPLVMREFHFMPQDLVCGKISVDRGMTSFFRASSVCIPVSSRSVKSRVRHYMLIGVRQIVVFTKNGQSL